MALNYYEQLKSARNGLSGWKKLEMTRMAYMGGYGWELLEWLKMIKNGWKLV